MPDRPQLETYLASAFGSEDDGMRSMMDRAAAAGLPRINVSSHVGRLLELLCALASREGGLAVEVGTLAGYSGAYLARGLAPGARLVTIELSDAHADFAEAEFRRAGAADRVEIRRGAGLEVLPRLLEEFGPGSADLVFLDAVKTEYEGYFETARLLLRGGGLLLADNVLGSGSWWVTDPKASSPERDAIDRFNRRVAADPAFLAACIANTNGVLVARRR